MNAIIKTFKITALLEGLSLLVLFANMLFIKPTNLDLYKTLLFPVGMSHGLLFIAYVILALIIGTKLQWKLTKIGLVLLASVIPFGTFYIEHKYLKQLS